jgi:hypothetical protein
VIAVLNVIRAPGAADEGKTETEPAEPGLPTVNGTAPEVADPLANVERTLRDAGPADRLAGTCT